MRFTTRILLLGLILLLTCATVVLWTKYSTIHRRYLALTSPHDTTAVPRVPEIPREFLKLSNYSSDVVYQPRLPNSQPYRLVVVSLSAGAYYKRRSAVRETWLKRLQSWNENREFVQIVHYFICFTPKKMVIKDDLVAEAEHYQVGIG